MRIYLAGPMRNIRDFNALAFQQATAMLRAQGNEVFSPQEEDEKHYGFIPSETGDLKDCPPGFSLRDALARDLAYICKRAEAIAFLPGSEKSRGATAEAFTAIALGLKFIHLKQEDYCDSPYGLQGS